MHKDLTKVFSENFGDLLSLLCTTRVGQPHLWERLALYKTELGPKICQLA